MSYGYQGPPSPFQRQKLPTSFGVPPGTPSAPPSVPQYSNLPTSFNMPQPNSPYPNYNAYPPQSLHYPNQGGPAMHQIGMPQPSMPFPEKSNYPSHNNPHQTSAHHYPAPSHSQSFSPPEQRVPSPFSQQHPYPSSGFPMQHDSSITQTSPMGRNLYPGPKENQSYLSTGFPTQHASAAPQNSSMGTNIYPNLTNLERNNSEPCFPPMNNRGYTPYSGGDYSGGRPNTGSFNYGGSVPHGSPLPAPRMGQTRLKLSPTVVCHDFNPRNDAEVLRKAMKGFGTDEKAIIQVLANRNNLQRQEIANQFKTLYGKDLIKDLKSETSGNFENLLVAMMTPLPQYYASELREAMRGIGTDENVLIEVMCTLSNHEIRVIKQAYETMYASSLEDHLRDDTSGNFERLMVSLCCGNRDENFEVDYAAAANDARQLLQAGELRFGTDESTFNAILVQRNINQLQQVFTEYLNITGHDIEEAISNEFSGDIKKGLLAIVKCVKNRAGFFAEQIYLSMKGLGTEDRRLIRLVVTRSEIDMGEIKQAFLQKYGQSMEAFISDDCSGHYKKCLLALIS